MLLFNDSIVQFRTTIRIRLINIYIYCKLFRDIVTYVYFTKRPTALIPRDYS